MIELIKLFAVIMAMQVALLFTYAGITFHYDRPVGKFGFALVVSIPLNAALLLILLTCHGAGQ